MNDSPRRSAVLSALVAFVALIFAVAPTAPARADSSAPATYSYQVRLGADVRTLDLVRVPLRSSGFEVRVQGAGGSFAGVTPVGERSYLGTVREDPDAYVSATRMDDGSWHAQIIEDRGATWWTEGSRAVDSRGLSQPTTFPWPTRDVLTTDAFGSDVYSYDVGVDVPSEYYAAVGGASSSLEMIEYSLNNTRAVYLHQVGVLQMLGRVVLRADSATDPYAGSSQITNTLKTAQGQWWPDGGAHADARVAQTIVPVSTDVGGVAFMSEFVHAANVAVSGSFTRGSRIGAFDVIGRHEMAHNWDLDDEHGGNPEGPTIESGNAYARFDLTELATLATTRAIGIEEGLMRPRPAWSAVALPPTGVADLAQVAASAASTAIDVLANDHSVTGSPLRVTSAGASGLSDRGQAVSVGADGVVRYTPSSVAGVTDHFTYRVTDAAGRGATVNVFVRSTASQDPVVPGLVDPVVPGSGDPVVPGSGSVDPVVSGSGSTDPVDSGSTDPVVAGALDQVDIVRDDTAGLGSAGAKAEAIASTDHVATGRDTLATTGRSLRPVLATTAAAIAIMLSGVLALLLSLRRQAQRGRQ